MTTPSPDEPSWSPWSPSGGVEDFSPTLATRFAALIPLGSMLLRHPLLTPYFATHEGGLVLTWLTREGCDDLGSVLALTEDAILGWPQIGHGKLQRILQLLADISIDARVLGDALLAAHDALAHQAADDSRRVTDDLDALAQWGDFAARAATWGAVESTLSRPSLPADVAAAATRLRALPTDTTAQQDPGDVLLAWIDALDQRDRHIFESRLVRVQPETLDAIGKAYDITRERVRQLETKLAQRARDLYDNDPDWRQVRWAGFLLYEALGSFAPRTAVDTRAADGEQRFDRWLLLWFAGIEVTDAGFRRLGWTLPRLDEVPLQEDTWVVDRAELDADLLERGVRAEFLDFAVDSIKGLARVDDAVVRWGASVVDRACALLALHGQPMEVSELHDVLGGSLRSLRGRLFDDQRITRVSRNGVGLSTWGAEAYDGVVNAMIRRVEDHGELVLDDLAAELAAQFGVSANSVAMYSAAPVFETGAGKIRLRDSVETFVPRSEPHKVAGLFQQSANVLRWNVTVDKDLKRGSGRALPTEIGTFLGVTPGVHIKVHGSVKDIPIGWSETSHTGPSIGSLKAYVDDLGAETGDVLQLRFDRRDRSLHVALRPQASTGANRPAVLAWLTGMPTTVTEDLDALAASIHVAPEDLETTLRARGDSVVADVVASG